MISDFALSVLLNFIINLNMASPYPIAFALSVQSQIRSMPKKIFKYYFIFVGNRETLRSGQLNRTIHKDFSQICELIRLTP